ncbi:hypothetical protein F5Y04DRAFT_146180 [Hypomontagnella monticulosa]|nr:hypothetical protein F5Y04DRAFT_146180 [Hypomontagnella monticulosa]
MGSSIPSIDKLGPEIFLKIFEHLAQDSAATLIPAILCCRKWHSLVLSVLYGDVVLNDQRLFKFVSNSTDHTIRSLTLRMDAIPSNPYEPMAAKRAAAARVSALRQLGPLIKRMKLLALSISLDIPYPFTAAKEISLIVENLTSSCTSLELDMRHSGYCLEPLEEFNDGISNPHPRLCNSIRSLLPQLQHLRLRLPVICPSILSTEAPDQQPPYQVTRAPMLKICIINLSMREPRSVPVRGMIATLCSANTTQSPYIGTGDHLPPPLPTLLPVLKEFARLNSANLERLWILDPHLDSKAHRKKNVWGGWIRRDVVSDTSFPIPVSPIGGFLREAWFARMPAPTDAEKTQDWLSTLELLEMQAEGNAWVEATSGARLPMAMVRDPWGARLAITREQYLKHNQISCMLWMNELEVGQHILPEGPGELMKQWELVEVTPSGWTRDNYDGSPLTRVGNTLV